MARTRTVMLATFYSPQDIATAITHIFWTYYAAELARTELEAKGWNVVLLDDTRPDDTKFAE